MNKQRVEIAVYYFPNWHPCQWNEGKYGAGNSEWVTVQKAKPRFPGHDQPKTPLWGYEDESDPFVMEKKIAAAADHGIDNFIYDWYWWEKGPSLEACLNRGFLRAKNNSRLKFALMWANHSPVSRKAFDRAVDYCVENYFPQQNYWQVEEGLYFSIYEMHTLLNGLGGIGETQRAFDSLRNKVKKAGYGEVHLNAVEWGMRNLPDASFEAQNRLIEALGIQSITDYVWVHHVELKNFPENDHSQILAEAGSDWDRFAAGYCVPYHPNVTMGWDPWPRVPADKPFEPGVYPATPLITNNSPDMFEKALQRARRWLLQPGIRHKILTINAWNEWTEGSYLEPDSRYGTGYLEAVRKVFSEKGSDHVC